MNERQKMFCREYIKDMNGTQAAIRAGYSKKTAGQQSEQLLKKLEIQEKVNFVLAKRAERVEIDADYVLQRLVEIDRMDVLDIMDDAMAFKPLKDWPEVWRRYLSSVDIAEIKEGASVIGVLKKVKWPDKVRNLELLGKHMAIGAFTEKVQLSTGESGPVQVTFKIVE